MLSDQRPAVRSDYEGEHRVGGRTSAAAPLSPRHSHSHPSLGTLTEAPPCRLPLGMSVRSCPLDFCSAAHHNRITKPIFFVVAAAAASRR